MREAGILVVLLGSFAGLTAQSRPLVIGDNPVAVASGTDDSVASLQHRAARHGTLLLRVVSAGEATLEVDRTRDGEGLKRPLSSGGRGPFAPLVDIVVKPGDVVSIRVQPAAADEPAMLRAAFAGHSEATHAVLIETRDRLMEVRKLREHGDRAAVAKAVPEIAAELLAVEPCPAAGRSLWTVGDEAWRLGDRELARRALSRALALLEQHWPAEHAPLQSLRLDLARLLFGMRDLKAAAPLAEEAAAVLSRCRPAEDRQLLRTLTYSGDIALAQRRFREARRYYERVLQQREALPANSSLRYWVPTELARVCAALGDRKAMLPYARQGYEACLALGDDISGGARIHARQRLASCLRSVDEYAESRELFELNVRELEKQPGNPNRMAAAYADLGRVLGIMDDPLAAKPNLEKALVIYREQHAPSHRLVLDTAVMLCLVLRDLSDHEQAVRMASELDAEIGDSVPDEHPLRTKLLHTLVGGLSEIDKRTEAIATQRRILEALVRRGPNARDDRVRAQCYLCVLMDDEPDLAERARAQFAELLAEVEGDESIGAGARAQVLFIQGEFMTTVGNFEEGIPYMERAYELLQTDARDDNPQLELIRGKLTSVYTSRGEYGKAAGIAMKLLGSRRKLPENSPKRIDAEIQILFTTMITDRDGAHDRAKKLLKRCVDRFGDNHPLTQQAKVAYGGTLMICKGDILGARRMFAEAERSNAKDRRYRGGRELARVFLALSDLILGNIKAPMPSRDAVSDLDSAVIANGMVKLMDGMMGSVRHMAVDDFEGALACLRGVREMEGLPRNPILLAGLDLLEMEPLYQLGRYEEAAQRARGMKPLRMVLPMLASYTNSSLARIAAAQGKLDEACALLAKPVRGRRNAFTSMSGLAHEMGARLALYESLRGKPEQATELIESSLDSAIAELRAKERAMTPLEVGGVLVGLEERISCAFALMQNSLVPGEVIVGRLFEMLETARGIDLSAFEFARAVESRAGAVPELAELRDELRDISEDMAAASQRGATRRLVDAMRDREMVQQKVLQLIEQHAGDAYSNERVTIAAVQAALPPEGAAVAYWRYRHWTLSEQVRGRHRERWHYGAWVVPAQGEVRWVDLGDTEVIGAAANRWLRGMGVAAGASRAPGRDSESGDGAGDAVAAGLALRALVLDPVLAQLGDIDELVVVPDDVLHTIPFDALPARESQARVLGDELAIKFVDRLRGLNRELAPIPTPASLLAMGGIDYEQAVGSAPDSLKRWGSPGELEALPGSFAEVNELGVLFREAASVDASAVEVVTGAVATKQVLLEKCREKRFLHLATHAWFVDADTSLGGLGSFNLGALGGDSVAAGLSPMVLCGLALAGANSTDVDGRAAGVVTAEELGNLPLRGCELAVLSACQTALGHRRPGQGLASLQKALRIAGARWTLTSLWRVPDEAARLLMTEFYRRVLSGEGFRSALWNAKRALRAMRKQDGSPRFGPRDWAVWVLRGPVVRSGHGK